MPFPFSIRYKKRLNALINDDNIERALKYIEERLEEKSADNIVRNGYSISYRGSTSYSGASLFGGLKGTLTIVTEDNTSYLIYELYTYKTFIANSFMSVAMFVVSHEWFVGVGSFLLLFGINWIIAILRHEYFTASVATGIW